MSARHLQRWVVVAAVTALLPVGGGGWSQGGVTTPPGTAAQRSSGTLETRPHAARAWRSGTYTTSTGDAVRVEVSDSYAPEAVSGQAWAEFFAGLVHGSELASVTARIGSPPEVAAVCGDDALGCYSGGLLVMAGEQFGGVEPQEIARHEYGHHVAASRANPPWTASAYGPKRWSSAMGICARTKAGTAFPDDYTHYSLSPGEAFAEAYRVLNDRKAGILGLTWSIVDDSFIPNDDTLRAVEQDVTTPWLRTTSSVVRGRFTARKHRSLTMLGTSLDGLVTVALRVPRGRADTLALVDPQDRVVATGLWAGATTRRLTYLVCGERRLTVRVVLAGPPGPYTLAITRP
ncbi:MAG: hypothetical protein WB684_14095 [Gaiella sp.]